MNSVNTSFSDQKRAPPAKKKKSCEGAGTHQASWQQGKLGKKSSSWTHKFGGLKCLFECAGGAHFFRCWASGAESFPLKLG